MSVKLAAVVVLYHPTSRDLKNIETYLADVDKLYVIDNTEKGEKPELPDSPKIEYITKHENLGVARALNLAAKKAIKAGYKWLLTNDQDTTFNKNVLPKLKERAAKAGPKIALITPWHNTKLKDPKPKTETDDPHDVMTSGNLINLKIWQKLGGFKEWFFIDGIDIEYCINLHKNGYKILRDNTVEIDHNLGNLFYKTRNGALYLLTNHPPIRRYYMMRNYHYIRDLYMDYDHDYCVNLVAAQKHNMKGVWYFEKQKFRKLYMYLRGYLDYCKNIKGKFH